MRNSMNKIVIMMATMGLVCGALLAILVITPNTKAADHGAQDLYGHKCAVCHGKDGAGSTAKGKKLKVKDVNSPEAQAVSKEKMIEIVTKGKGKDMDGYEKELSKEQIEAVVDYYRALAKK